MPMLRNLLCCVMIVVLPASLFAADADAAMLYAGGSTWLNGSPVPRSSAVFPGDLVQTNRDAAANINAAGSSVVIASDSLIKFEGNTVSLEHGTVTVASARRMSARVGNVTVAPVSDAWTEFDVNEGDGTVRIAARKGDLTVSDGDDTRTLSQGQQTTREKKKKRRRAGGAIPPGGGAILDSPFAVWLGVGAVGGVVLWVLLQGDDPLSTDTPSRLGAR